MSQPAQQHRPLIGLMLGDVTGIGPEVSARVLADPTLHEQARMVVVGDARVLASALTRPSWMSGLWSCCS